MYCMHCNLLIYDDNIFEWILSVNICDWLDNNDNLKKSWRFSELFEYSPSLELYYYYNVLIYVRVSIYLNKTFTRRKVFKIIHTKTFKQCNIFCTPARWNILYIVIFYTLSQQNIYFKQETPRLLDLKYLNWTYSTIKYMTRITSTLIFFIN